MHLKYGDNLEIKVLTENENKLINRKEAKCEIAYAEAPPKRLEIRDAIAQKFNTEPKKVVVTKIKNAFGLRKSIVYANLYNVAEDVKKYESSHIVKRMKLESKEKPAEEKKEGEQ